MDIYEITTSFYNLTANPIIPEQGQSTSPAYTNYRNQTSYLASLFFLHSTTFLLKTRYWVYEILLNPLKHELPERSKSVKFSNISVIQLVLVPNLEIVSNNQYNLTSNKLIDCYSLKSISVINKICLFKITKFVIYLRIYIQLKVLYF